MKDKQFLNIIERAYPVRKQAMYEDLKRELNLPDITLDSVKKPVTAKPAGKWRNNFKNFFKTPARLAACISMAVAVICLAIVLPVTLNQSGLQPANPTQTQKERYCYAASCREDRLSYTLKEYSELNKLSLLYVDWYGVAEIKTSLHVDKRNRSDVIFYQEILMHNGIGSIVELYITDAHTKVDVVEEYKKTCGRVYVIKQSNVQPYNVRVFWGTETAENGGSYTYKAYFTYEKYIYTVVLRYPMDGNDIFELIDSMLPTYGRPMPK